MIILKDFTAGHPMKENILWTNLSCSRISELFLSFGIKAGVHVVKQLLKSQGYVRRKLVKSKTMSVVEDRNEQFEYISNLKQDFLSQGLPVLSIDTKKKETIGDFYRAGHLYSQSPVEVNDHDFNSFGEGTVVPYGIYDVYQDKCYLTLGVSKDTAEFVCDNLYYWWENAIKYYYPATSKLLLLCDGGGSNSCRHHVVKEALYRLSKKMDIEIIVAHYPAYCSKWNPIEHKAFSHITRAWQGAVFQSYEMVANLAKTAHTKTGFSVEVSINNIEYETGKKASAEFMEKYPVKYANVLPKWNYSFN